MEKYGFVYLWYDKKHKRFYIGCRWGREDDGYICSSTWMKQGYKHRPSDFKRRILERVYTYRKDLLETEYKWLLKVKNDELGKRYYNLQNNHFGHWSSDENTKLSVGQKISEKMKELHQDPEYKNIYDAGVEKRRGVKHTPESVEKRAYKLRGQKRSEETKRKIGDSHRGKIVGPLSDETKRKISESLSGNKNPFYGKQHDPEKKKEMNEKTSKTMKGRVPKNIESFKGSKWWNNGTQNKRSQDCPGDNWVRGIIS